MLYTADNTKEHNVATTWSHAVLPHTQTELLVFIQCPVVWLVWLIFDDEILCSSSHQITDFED